MTDRAIIGMDLSHPFCAAERLFRAKTQDFGRILAQPYQADAKIPIKGYYTASPKRFFQPMLSFEDRELVYPPLAEQTPPEQARRTKWPEWSPEQTGRAPRAPNAYRRKGQRQILLSMTIVIAHMNVATAVKAGRTRAAIHTNSGQSEAIAEFECPRRIRQNDQE